MTSDALLARACDRIPALVRGALLLVPDGILLGNVGGDRVSELEPLLRAAVRALALRITPAVNRAVPEAFSEYTFVIGDELVLVRGSRNCRLALAAVCTREPNLAFAMSATRAAMAELEAELDLSHWGL